MKLSVWAKKHCHRDWFWLEWAPLKANEIARRLFCVDYFG